MKQLLNISDIETCAGTQTRVAINEDTVAEYAEAMTGGDVFPPVVVFHDSTTYYLADGFHRCLAASRIKLKEIDAEVHKGTKVDALIYSLGANRANGLRRTNADKRQCVKIALQEFADWSDRRIAEVCGVSYMTVNRIRDEVSQSDTCPPADAPEPPAKSAKRKGKDGKQYPSKPTAPATPPEQQDEQKPPAETYTIKTKPLPPSSGMQYATLAISQLEKINNNDTQREQALNHVANWIKDQLKG